MIRVRFTLRTMFFAITAAAIVFGVYWLAWPRYQAYREQSQFETVAKQFKAGITQEAAQSLLPRLNWHRGGSLSFGSDEERLHVSYSAYFYGSAVYCVLCYKQRGPGSAGPGTQWYTGVELYRLPPLPKDYRLQLRPTNEFEAVYDERPERAYIFDFLQLVTGLAAARNDNIQLHYELIHADPNEIRDPTAPEIYRRKRSKQTAD